jgi:Cof subfamily protein (haloacid dehalogenase superfamily)
MNIAKAHGIRAIAFDLDGTLLTPDKTITKRSIDMIKQLKTAGILPIIATGRSITLSTPYTSQLNINTPLICYNGACVYDMQQQKDLWHETIPTAISKALIALSHPESVSLQIFCNHTIYYDEKGRTADYIEPLTAQIGTVVDLNNLPSYNFTKMMYIGPTNDTKHIWETLKHTYPGQIHLVYSDSNYLEVLPVGCNKGTALARLLATYNISAKETMAFGDGDNDLEMLQWANYGIAMGNATNLVKSSIQRMTQRNDQEGIANYLETFFGNFL